MPVDVVEAAAKLIAAEANARIEATGRFCVLLAGGSTPKSLYARLAGPDYRAKLDWDRMDFFWGDERCVAPTHPDSNYLMAAGTLLADKPDHALHIYRIQGELGAVPAAEKYEREILDYFAMRGIDQPVFDLVLLGIGEDGHTASIFPGTQALIERQKWVMAVPHRQPPPPLVDRVTVTFRLINSARQVLFLVTGASKADVIQQALSEISPAGRLLPVHQVQPVDGSITWILDRAAAGSISPGQTIAGHFSIG